MKNIKIKNENSSSQNTFSHSKSLSATRTGISSLERVASFISFSKPGSLTVETALVLPVFLFLCLAMVFFGQIFLVYQEVQGALLQAARSISTDVLICAIGDDGKPRTDFAGTFIGVSQARKIVMDNAKETLDACSCVVDGADGLQFGTSRITSDTVDLIVNYKVFLPYGFGLDTSFPIVQRCRMKTWTGAAGQSVDEELVYITENGGVYHASSECSHIKLQVRSVSSLALSTVRNGNGGKYYPCDKCARHGLTGGVAYITNEGDRYHNSLNCSGLKRTVKSCSKSEVGDMRPCSRCCE